MRRFSEYIEEETSQINVGEVRSSFEKILFKFTKKSAKPGEIAQAIRKLSEKYLFSVSTLKHPDVDEGNISVWGGYDSSVDKEYAKSYIGSKGTFPIELILLFSSKDNQLIFTKEGINEFARYLSETLAHEWIHLRQARKRKWLNIKDKPFYKVTNIELGSYLGNPDEIEAHAFNIAGSILDKFGSKKAGIRFLKNPKEGQIADHHFDMYIRTFGKEHFVIKKLIKKIVLFMDKRQ